MVHCCLNVHGGSVMLNTHVNGHVRGSGGRGGSTAVSTLTLVAGGSCEVSSWGTDTEDLCGLTNQPAIALCCIAKVRHCFTVSLCENKEGGGLGCPTFPLVRCSCGWAQQGTEAPQPQTVFLSTQQCSVGVYAVRVGIGGCNGCHLGSRSPPFWE